ncbi:ankyrin repeat-containing domain protein, partial [Hyaloscypha sp. PMI_1271]
MLESAGFTTQDAAGNGLLQIAALGGHSKVAEILLDGGININSVDRNHGTALQAAIYIGGEGPTKVIRLLLDWDQINVNTKGGYYGCALQVAAYRANSELVRELVNDCNPKADVNISGGKFGFPLQAAVRTGRRAVVEPILSVKSDPVNINAKGGKYGTTLQAVARGKYRTREKLPEISRGQVLIDLCAESGIHGTALRAAIAAEHERVAQCLIIHQAKGDAEYGNILQLATSRGLVSTVELLLKYGADPNIQDTSDRRALHIASWFGFPEIVDLLLTHGAEINAK